MKKILSISMFLLISAINTFSQGDLLVTPVRVIFDGNKQKEEISLVNIGNDTAVYTVSFLQYNMTEEGTIELINNKSDNQMFADKYLRIFPRRVVLGPRESQVLRLQLRRSADMIPGEYRSHLYFRAEKESAPIGLSTGDEKLMSVQITPVFGISIPVIVRTGDVSVKSSITDVKLGNPQDSLMTLKLSISRSGNMSVYGDIIVDFIPARGKPVEIGSVRGVAIYTSISRRNFTVRLNDTNMDLSRGRIRVRFTTPKDFPYEVFAEKELALN